MPTSFRSIWTCDDRENVSGPFENCIKLHADLGSIFATSDDVFESFVKVLDESQGDLLREISNAAKQAFEHIIYQDTRHQNLFALEMTAPDHIQGWPKGSRELLSLLY